MVCHYKISFLNKTTANTIFMSLCACVCLLLSVLFTLSRVRFINRSVSFLLLSLCFFALIAHTFLLPCIYRKLLCLCHTESTQFVFNIIVCWCCLRYAKTTITWLEFLIHLTLSLWNWYKMYTTIRYHKFCNKAGYHLSLYIYKLFSVYTHDLQNSL